MLSINPVIGQEKEEKRTIDKKTLLVEKGEKVRKEGSIVGQSVLVADQELGKTDLSQNDSSLVDVLANLLDDENLVTVLTAPPPISTNTGLIDAHGNCIPCSEIDMKVPKQDVQDQDIIVTALLVLV